MLEVLYEAPGLPGMDLPADLRARYGGNIGLTRTGVIANFVASLDGVTALPEHERSSALISAGNPGDRFVMGLLRACADAVLIGAGTLRAHPRSTWTPDGAFPDSAEDFAELRSRLGMSERPRLAVVTTSGRLDLDHPGLVAGSIVLTTLDGKRRLAHPNEAIDIVVVGNGEKVEPAAMIAALRDRAIDLILHEGGPTLFGELLSAGLVDELFLTISPRIAGRSAQAERLGLVEATAFAPDSLRAASLRSARRLGSHLLLRYGLAT